MDDPLQILREAGIECPEEEAFREHRLIRLGGTEDLPPDDEVNGDVADAAILALAELAAKQAWMLRYVIERVALTPERWSGWTTSEVLADLEARWEARDE